MIQAALVAMLAGGAACGGDSTAGGEEGDGPPGLVIRFSRHELLRDASLLAIYFYDPSTTCADIRASLPRPPSILGPYTAALDAAARKEGITFTLKEVPAGSYVVYIDALDDNGALVGDGCAPEQRVLDRQVSRIQVSVS